MAQAPVQRDARQSFDVARLVRLHHRRRGWAWVATASVIGLAVYAGIGVHAFAGLTGTAEILGLIPVYALTALVLVGLVVVIVDTARLHRADEAVRIRVKSSVSHYPLYAHAHRWPPRHPASWIAGVFMLVAMTCITGFYLPAEVNAWAYVVGAEHQDTFHPVSYSQNCTPGNGRTPRSSCITVTEGYLYDSGVHVTWTSRVPLGQPFSVRDPLWRWGTGRNLISGDGSAIPTIVAGLFFDGVALLLLYVLAVLMRETSPRRKQRMSAAAGADPGGTHPATHHPESTHHGSGARRRSHHRRGRR
jgi:hypothetical protein